MMPRPWLRIQPSSSLVDPGEFGTDAAEADAWHRSPADDENRQPRNQQECATANDCGGKNEISGSPDDGEQQIEQPGQDSAAEN